jgi:iron complex transport system substrate-binding protein
MMRRNFLVAAGMLLALVGTAEARPFTDAGGRIVEIPDTITRVLPAGPPAAVLVYSVSPDALAGWINEPSAKAKPFLLPDAATLPAYGRLTGKGGTANMEAVLAAKPDIIIDVGTVNDTYASLADKVQAQTGIPYILIDGSFAKTAETYRLLGDLLGEKDRAELLAAYAEKTQTELTEGLAKVSDGQHPRVYYGRGADGLETGMKGSINLEILGVVGAVNVAETTGEGGLTTVSPEQVLGWNPDIIIAADPAFAASVKTDPVWSEIAAVKNGKVFAAPTLPFGWFDSPPGVNRLIGVNWLENLFYPEIFKNDLPAEVKAFYKTVYQVELTDDQVKQLLTGAIATP